MRFLIDDANVEKIKEIYTYYPVDGVTTNPSILAKSKRQPYDVLQEIRELIGPDADLHVQAVSRKAEDMVAEAHRIREALGENTYIKIPAVPEGIRAIRILASEGCRTTATAIYTPMQAFLAAKAGADYAAPYVNRMDNLGAGGIGNTKIIHDIFQKNGLKTQVLALCRYGVGAATIAPDVIEGLLKNDSVAAAVDAFIHDFEDLCGEGKTM